jgi:hypothetical protein
LPRANLLRDPVYDVIEIGLGHARQTDNPGAPRRSAADSRVIWRVFCTSGGAGVAAGSSRILAVRQGYKNEPDRRGLDPAMTIYTSP